MNRDTGYVVAAATLLVLLAGAWRWTGGLRSERVVYRTVTVTNWANPEEVRMPPNYTNYNILLSTGYCHWFIIVSNRTDDWEVHYK